MAENESTVVHLVGGAALYHIAGSVHQLHGGTVERCEGVAAESPEVGGHHGLWRGDGRRGDNTLLTLP